MTPQRRARRIRALILGRNVLLAVFVVSLLVAVLPDASDAAGVVPGSAGVDTALPATDSEVTVRGRDEFADLEITVNQTKNLANQAISVTWRGATPTVASGGSTYGTNFLQIYQCWGEDDGTDPTNPGPSPERCEAGAAGAVQGGVTNADAYPLVFAASRLISRTGWDNYDPAIGVTDTRNGNNWLPFEAVDGTRVDIPIDPTFNPSIQGGNYWLNPYYNSITTNEIPAAATGPDGTGQKLFQTATGLEAPGLGCGAKAQPTASGAPVIPRCWLVVVPRGDTANENAGTPLDPNGVSTSGLAPQAWQHRIAIPLEFNPVDSPCSIDAASRRIVGSELLVGAITSWQPALCTGAAAPPFVYGTIADGSARQQIIRPSVGAPGMAVTPRPIEPALDDPKSPTVYAPLSLSGLTIAFAVERYPRVDAPAEEHDLDTVRVENINLTPRLVAKLLTQSYTSQVDITGRAVGLRLGLGQPRRAGGRPRLPPVQPGVRAVVGDGPQLRRSRPHGAELRFVPTGLGLDPR